MFLAGVTSSISFMYENGVQTMYDLFKTLQVFMIAALLLAQLLESLFGRDITKEYFELWSKCDLNNPTSSRDKPDHALSLLVCLGIICIISSAIYILKLPLTVMDVSFRIGCTICILHGLKSTMMKNILVKRLCVARFSARSLGTVEKLISDTRQILDWNSSLNCADGPTATFLGGLMFVTIFRQCYSFWIVFGTYVDFAEDMQLFWARSFLYMTSLSISIMLATVSSAVAAEIEEIKMELDISVTTLPCTRKQQRAMSLFMLELHHSPVELSAMGFFDINRPTLVSALAVIISCLLVLIQFSLGNQPT
ncbi:hypothetical protein J6590_043212 [Homalodisca vitripennis]|nr:hypothetical protein J6590_043212 [Homalodisca vitripennis]